MVARLTASARFGVAVAAVLVLSAGLYVSALGGGFVWDDFMLADGSAIGGGHSIAECFRQPFLFHYYRPLVSLSFLMDLRLWPGDPVRYHLVNLLLHVASVGAVVGLTRAAFERRSVAIVAGLLFAVHPVHVGVVAWIGGRTDALGALWTALFAWGLVASVRTVGDRSSAWTTLSVLAYTAALFTKEQSLFLLPLVPLAHACFGSGHRVVVPRSVLAASGPFVVASCFYIAIGAFLGMPSPPRLWAGLEEQLLRFGWTVLHYAALLLFPAQRGMHALGLGAYEARGVGPAAIGYKAVLCAVLLFAYWWRRDRPSAWFLLFAALSLAPVSNLLPLPFILVAPYRAAIAAIAVTGLLARHLTGARLRLRGSSVLIGLLFVPAVAGYYAVQTMVGIGSWADERRLFTTVLRYDPRSLVAHYMLASRATEAGADTEVETHVTAILQELYRSDAWRGPDSALKALDHDRAVRARVRQNQGHRGEPREYASMLFVHLGYARLGLGKHDDAEVAFRTALAMEPQNPDALHGMGRVDVHAGQWSDAERRLLAELQVRPSVEANRMLARVYDALGRASDAARQRALAGDAPPPRQ